MPKGQQRSKGRRMTTDIGTGSAAKYGGQALLAIMFGRMRRRTDEGASVKGELS